MHSARALPSRGVPVLALAVVAATSLLAAPALADDGPTCRPHVSRHHAARRPSIPRDVGHGGFGGQASGNVQYYGGHVISHVQVVPVNWGPSVVSSVATGAETFYGKIVDSPYMDWLGEYDTVGQNGVDGAPGSEQRIYRGRSLGAVTITPSVKGSRVSDTSIQAELALQIDNGVLPKPSLDAKGGVNTIYMLAFPPGVIVDDGSGEAMCSAWCAYHSSFSYTGVAAGVPYAVMPDFSKTCTQCGDGSAFDQYTQSASHELMEAVTDPEVGGSSSDVGRPMAWLDPATSAGEVGDICENDPSNFLPYQGFVVQKIWSQRLGQCITDDPSLELCTGATRPCRPCGASDCNGKTPTCDADPSSDKYGQCVGCQTNAQCTQTSAPVCDSGSGACRGCTSTADCGAGTTCDTASGACSAPKSGSSSPASDTTASGGASSGSASSNPQEASQAPQSQGCAASPARSTSTAWPLLALVACAAAVSRRRRSARKR